MPDNNASTSIQMPEDPAAVGNAPGTVGMMTPQAPEGDIESAKLDAYHCCRLIDRAIAKLGRKSEYSSALMRARTILTAQFGEHEEDSAKYSDAEIKRMVLTLAGPGQTVQKQGQAQPPQQQPPGGGAQPPQSGM